MRIFFRSAFSRIWTELRGLQSKITYLVQIWKKRTRTPYSDTFYVVKSPQLLYEIYPQFNLGMEEKLSLNLIAKLRVYPQIILHIK